MDLEASHRLVSHPEATEWNEVLPRRGRNRNILRTLTNSCADQYASLLIFFQTLCIHFETLLAVTIAAASPCFFHYYTPEGKAMAFDLSWTIITVAAAFPLTMTLTAVFQRRETGLVHLSDFKANIISIFLAHRDWDWWTLGKKPTDPSLSGRLERLPRDHVASIHKELKRTVALARKVLVAPIVSRVRHYYSDAGRKERKMVGDLTSFLNSQLTEQFHKLSVAGEELKSSGLPANEAARLRQYLSALIAAWNKLRVLKIYRTPLGLRSFSRVYIFATPIMFGPYYAQLSASTNLIFAIALSIMTTLAMQGLFNLRYALEDPFDNDACGDAIDVRREMAEVETDLDVLHFGITAAFLSAPSSAGGPSSNCTTNNTSLVLDPAAGVGACVLCVAPDGLREFDPRPSWASANSTVDMEISLASSGL